MIAGKQNGQRTFSSWVKTGFLAVGLLGLQATAYGALEKREVTTMAGKQAPIIRAKTVQHTSPVKTDKARGKLLLVNFFASWCPPCQDQLEVLQEIRDTIPADQLVVVGVAWDAVVSPDTISDVKPTLEDLKVDLPVVLATKALVKAFDCPGFPATYIISPDGKFIKALYGYHSPKELKSEIKALLPKGTVEEDRRKRSD